jgi:hypothetical protein
MTLRSTFFSVGVWSLWARVPGIILAILYLPGIPIGTIVGAYGLYALVGKDAKELFLGARHSTKSEEGGS